MHEPKNRNFSQIAGNRTTLLIFHPLGITKLVDRIIVCHDWRITEDDAHQELMEKKVYCYDMHQDKHPDAIHNKYSPVEESDNLQPGIYQKRAKSLENITSERGIHQRMNRSNQAGGAFGLIKNDFGFRRSLRKR